MKFTSLRKLPHWKYNRDAGLAVRVNRYGQRVDQVRVPAGMTAEETILIYTNSAIGAANKVHNSWK